MIVGRSEAANTCDEPLHGRTQHCQAAMLPAEYLFGGMQLNRMKTHRSGRLKHYGKSRTSSVPGAERAQLGGLGAQRELLALAERAGGGVDAVVQQLAITQRTQQVRHAVQRRQQDAAQGFQELILS